MCIGISSDGKIHFLPSTVWQNRPPILRRRTICFQQHVIGIIGCYFTNLFRMISYVNNTVFKKIRNLQLFIVTTQQVREFIGGGGVKCASLPKPYLPFISISKTDGGCIKKYTNPILIRQRLPAIVQRIRCTLLECTDKKDQAQ